MKKRHYMKLTQTILSNYLYYLVQALLQLIITYLEISILVKKIILKKSNNGWKLSHKQTNLLYLRRILELVSRLFYPDGINRLFKIIVEK